MPHLVVNVEVVFLIFITIFRLASEKIVYEIWNDFSSTEFLRATRSRSGNEIASNFNAEISEVHLNIFFVAHVRLADFFLNLESNPFLDDFDVMLLMLVLLIQVLRSLRRQRLTEIVVPPLVLPSDFGGDGVAVLLKFSKFLLKFGNLLRVSVSERHSCVFVFSNVCVVVCNVRS